MVVSYLPSTAITEINPTTLSNTFLVHVYSHISQRIKYCMSFHTFLKQEIVDDYTFECEVGGQAQKTKVSIFQSMGDPLVYGKIYCAKEQKAEEENTDLKLIHPP